MSSILPNAFASLTELPQDAVAIFRNGKLAILTSSDSAVYDLSTGQALPYTEKNGSIEYSDEAEAMLEALSTAACALAEF